MVDVGRVIEMARKARGRLLALPGVYGVGHDWKRTKGRKTARYAAVVYVRAKLDKDQLARGEIIPSQLDGVPTDVVVMGSAKDAISDEHERRFIDYVKLHKEIVKSAPRKVPVTGRDRDVGNVAVIEDDPNHSFLVPGRQDVDWVAAYQKFRLTHPDRYDFVTFWSDFQVDCSCGAFYCGLVNPTRGINWSACLGGGRAGWNSKRLLGFMYFIREDDAALLQEIGHHWMAYTGFRQHPSDRTSYELCLDDKPGHWSSYFDDDASPMDYDESVLGLPTGDSVDWVARPDGTFEPRLVTQGKFRYCNLDRYLMGCIEPQEVGDFYFIKKPRRVGRRIAGTKVSLTVDTIIWANGRRVPDASNSPKAFRNAFVLLTKDAPSSVARARQINKIATRMSERFAVATGDRMQLSTAL